MAVAAALGMGPAGLRRARGEETWGGERREGGGRAGFPSAGVPRGGRVREGGAGGLRGGRRPSLCGRALGAAAGGPVRAVSGCVRVPGAVIRAAKGS